MIEFWYHSCKNETMKNLFLLLISLMSFAACQSTSAPANTSIETGYKQAPSTTETKPSDSLHNMDTSVMIVDSTSHITFNGMPLQQSDNSVYNTVYNSWLQAYQTTKHLPLAFKLIQQGTVTMGIRGNIGDALLKVQDDMKNYISKDKYKKPFVQLDAAVKDSLKKMHPVLFARPV